jgi:hypothetical protein
MLLNLQQPFKTAPQRCSQSSNNPSKLPLRLVSNLQQPFKTASVLLKEPPTTLQNCRQIFTLSSNNPSKLPVAHILTSNNPSKLP